MLNFLPIAATVIGFAPFLVAHFYGQFQHDHLSHFPVTLALVALLAYQARGNVTPPRPAFSLVGLALSLLAFSSFASAVHFRSAWLGTLSALFAIWAVIEFSGGRQWRSAFRPAIIMSLALLQPPFGTDQALIIGLQKLASKIAGNWLDLNGIANTVTGVVVRTPDGDYLVEEACSGVNSLFAAATLALFWVLHARYRFFRSLLFFALVLFWVVFVNAIRVWVIVYSDQRLGINLTDEPNHTILGAAMFGLVLLLAVSTDRLIQFLLPARLSESGRDPQTDALVSSPETKRRFSMSVALASLIVFVAGSIAFYRPATAVAQGVIADQSLFPDVEFGLLPKRYGNWELQSTKRVERDPTNEFGLVSYVWFYSNGDVPIVISLDGPYSSWHDLGYCYGAIGWQLRDARNLDLAATAGDEPQACVELNFYRDSGQRSVVIFTSFDSQGRVIQPPSSHGSILRTITNRLGMTNARATSDEGEVVPPVFQVQLRTETDFELLPEDRLALDQLYDFARRQLANRLFGKEPAE